MKVTSQSSTQTATGEVGALFPIVEMFQHAQSKLKYPAVRFATFDSERKIRISIAGANANPKNRGCLYVTSNELSWQDRTYYGKISTSGEWLPVHIPRNWHPRLWGTFRTELHETLKKFAENPREYAKITGQKYNFCCFCGRELTQKDSVACGYGPICAENYGLPHAGMAKVVEREEIYQDALKDVEDFASDVAAPYIDIGGHKMHVSDSKLADAYARDTTIETLSLYLARMVADAYNTQGKAFNARYHAEKILELVEENE